MFHWFQWLKDKHYVTVFEWKWAFWLFVFLASLEAIGWLFFWINS